MKRVVFCLPLVLLLAAIVTAQEPVKKETLGQFRAKYLGQRILIRKPGTVTGTGDLLEWHSVKPVGDTYVEDYPFSLNARYASQEPTVVAISLNEMVAKATGQASSSAGALNALGERVTDDDVENPPVDLVVRFDDGQVAKHSGFVSVLDGFGETEGWADIELVSVRDAHAAYLQKALPEVIGRSIYAIAASKVFPINSTIQDLTDYLAAYHRGVRALDDVPYLQKLRIVEARYSGATDRAVLKLQLPDGRFALAATPCEENRGPDALSRIAGRFLTAIPTGLTPREVKAIQEHKIFRGMTRRAVIFSWGTPEKEND